MNARPANIPQMTIDPELLIGLPLFLGMSRSDVDDIIADTGMSVTTCAKGRIVAGEGDVCRRIVFLLDGTVDVGVRPYDNGYTLTERIGAPDVFQTERLFGLTQLYSRTCRTATRCRFIFLDKPQVMTMMQRYVIFRLNLMNMICTQAQKADRMLWRDRPEGVRRKIVRFIEERCLRPAGHKTLSIRMERLAREIGESRLNVSRTLNDMAARGDIILSRAEITVPAIDRLIGSQARRDAAETAGTP